MAVWSLGDGQRPWSGLMRFYAAEAGRIGGSQWVLSMDIGQAVDPSAITLVEKIENPGVAAVRDAGRRW